MNVTSPGNVLAPSINIGNSTGFGTGFYQAAINTLNFVCDGNETMAMSIPDTIVKNNFILEQDFAIIYLIIGADSEN